MIPIRKHKISISGQTSEEALRRIKRKTSNYHRNIDLAGTGEWVIDPERLFVGVNHDDGSISISRYRSPTLRFFPAVIVKISPVLSEGILISYRCRLITSVGLFLLLYASISGIYGVLTQTVSPDRLGFLLILIIGWGLAIREAKIIEKMIRRLI